MQASAELARATFQGPAFSFHLVAPQANIRGALSATFARITQEKPETLLILSIGHGEIAELELPRASYPPLATPGGIYPEQPLSFLFMNGRHQGEVSRGTESDYGKGHIGTGDWRSLISAFLNANPQATVKILFAQCYGGQATRLLNWIPGVEAYSASSDHLKAKIYPSPKFQRKVSFLDYFLHELGASRLDIGERAFASAFERARKDWVQFLTAQKQDAAEVPWTPTDARINHWCSGGEAPTAGSIDSAAAALTLAYEKLSHEHHSKLSGCANAKRLRLHQQGLETAKQLWSTLMRDWARKTRALGFDAFRQSRGALRTPFYEDILLKEKLLAIASLEAWEAAREALALAAEESALCLEREPATHCLKKLPQELLSQLVDTGSWDSGKTNRLCSYETDENIAPCLRASGGIAGKQLGLATENVKRILVRTITHAVEACSPQRLRHYEQCHARFWGR